MFRCPLVNASCQTGRRLCCILQAAEAAEAAKVQAAKAAALAQKQVQMEQLEHMKQRILEER
jgi:hypothetical protein